MPDRVPIDLGGRILLAEYLLDAFDHVLDFLQTETPICVAQLVPSSRSVR